MIKNVSKSEKEIFFNNKTKNNINESIFFCNGHFHLQWSAANELLRNNEMPFYFWAQLSIYIRGTATFIIPYTDRAEKSIMIDLSWETVCMKYLEENKSGALVCSQIYFKIFYIFPFWFATFRMKIVNIGYVLEETTVFCPINLLWLLLLFARNY